MDRAENKELMKKSLSKLVRLGLAVEIDAMKAAMNNPLSCYEWVRKCNPNFDQRLKTSAISFQGGVPVFREEKLNLLLGYGLDPQKLTYMRNIAKDIFKDKGNELQDQLKIKIGRSAYVYMIPDFWGVLEPDAVYIEFSSFTDGINGLSNVTLNSNEVLVARSSAHYPSYIQRVKAIAKIELVRLKNIIVFSTKDSTNEDQSLASKLSSGDYDRDQA
ncbi:hypothetical protein IFR05_000467 [Cadophora sp. M221]|nr:hypothetical protein IFR05_000467 [Cadophora sp. M221]